VRYDAFISYSHGADAPIAAALVHEIARLGKPFYRRSSAAIFHDQTNLSASPHLWNEIAANLDAADHLILVASPEAAASKWVQKELCAWLTHGSCSEPRDFDPSAADAERRRHLFFVVTAGDVAWDDASGDFDWTKTTALPRMLSRVFDGEPLWVDLRFARGAGVPLDRSNAEFMSAAARIGAPVRSIPLETLIGLDYREHRRMLRVVATVAVVLFALLVGVAIATWFYVGANRILELRQAEILTSQGTLISALPPGQPLTTADITVIDEAMREYEVPSPPGGMLDNAHVAMLLYMRGLAAFERLRGDSTETTESIGRLRWRMPRIQQVWTQPADIRDIVVSHDGTRVAIASGTVARVLDRASGRSIATLEHPTVVHVVRFSPDARRLATGSGDKSLRLWDIESGTPVTLDLPLRECEPDSDFGDSDVRPRCDESDHGIGLVEFSPEGRFIAAAHGDVGNTATSDVYVWNGVDDRYMTLETSDRLSALAFSSKGTYLAAGTLDGQLSLFRAGTFDMLGQWPSLSDLPIKTVNSLAFTTDESLLAAGGDDGTIRTWNTDTRVRHVAAGQKAITGIAFRMDGRTLAVASDDRTITGYPMNADGTLDLRQSQTITAPAAPMRLAYGARDAFLVAAVGDGSIRAWSMPGGTEILTASSPSGRVALTQRDGAVHIADASRRVVTLNPDEQGSARHVVRPPGRDPNSLQYFDSAEGALIDHDGEDGVARWVSAETGKMIAEARVMSASTGEGFSYRDGVFTTPSGPDLDQVDVVRLRDGRVERATLNPTPRGRPMAVGARGSRLALLLNESSIGVWDTASGKLLGTYTFTPVHDPNRPTTDPWALALDQDATRLAMIDHARRLLVWRIDGEASAPRVFKGKDDFFEVAFASRTGDILATDDDRIMVYDGESGVVRCEIPHTRFFRNIVVSPSGSELIAVTGGKGTRLEARAHRLADSGCPAQNAVDLGTDEPIHVAVGRVTPVFAVSTATKGATDRIHVIEIASGRRLAIIPLAPTAAPGGWFDGGSAAFSRGDRYIVTANRSGFRFWPWRLADILEDARSRIAAKK
jgi:WD40 repeat protein